MKPFLFHLTVPCLLLCLTCLAAGCDPVSRHRAWTTLLDGKPGMPPAAELCQEALAQHEAAEAAAAAAAVAAAESLAAAGSSHPPFAAEECDSCHDFDQKSGLHAAPPELCFFCHQEFSGADFVHGPVAVGDCLTCHQPHEAPHNDLLVAGPAELCQQCHGESRLAERLHRNVAERELVCNDCHDRHAGRTATLLK